MNTPSHHTGDTRAALRRRILFLCGVAIVLLAGIVAFASFSHGSFMSPEVKFTDASKGGLSIVPASCPSNPGDAEDPNGCAAPPNSPDGLCPDGSIAPSGNPAACGGNYPSGPSPLCPANYVMQNGGCVPATTDNLSCPAGYTLQNSECISTTSECPLGYTKKNSECSYTGCPANYSLQNGECVQKQCSVGYICGADGNLYTEDSSCAATVAQTCSWGCSGNACNATPATSGAIIAGPPLLVAGNTTNISWSASNVQSCTITGSNGDGQGWSCSGTGCEATSTQTSSLIESQTIYTMSCTALDDSTFTKTVTVNVVPNFHEQ